jgi:PPE-repeat protein
MRLFLIVLLLSAACAVRGQSTNAPVTVVPITNAAPSQTGQSMEAQASSGGQHSVALTELKPNELRAGRFVISGIAVEAVKQRNPLQLINPLAPSQYGSPDDNIVRDPTRHRVGLKVFAIRF